MTLELRVNIEKIEIPVVLNSGETCNLVFMVANESDSRRETL